VTEPVRFLYVHVPFCATVCPFCSFDVAVGRHGEVDRYLRRLAEELASVSATVPTQLDTWYFGGGTPSMLRNADFARLCSLVRDAVGDPSVEFTLEVHPANATSDRIRMWADCGVTRFSIGAQSFDDEVLTRLGRSHTAQQARAAIEWARATEAVVSLDLLIATPGQQLLSDLETATSLDVDHLSAYALTIEPHTPFEGTVVVTEDRAEEAIRATERIAVAAGFERYEISNYAKPGHQCHHNRAYWNNEYVLGVGPSAASHLPIAFARSSGDASLAPDVLNPEVVAVRRTNPTFKNWMERSFVAEHSTEDERTFAEHLSDAVFCGLRLTAGIDRTAFVERYGCDLVDRFAEPIGRGIERGWLELTDASLAATDTGRMVLDRVVAEFL
jgi:oxygen-independent coproporphyrinogen-3 oxidase